MARKAKPPPDHEARKKYVKQGFRPEASYKRAARKLSSFAPQLKKYATKKRLTSAEKSAISRIEKRLVTSDGKLAAGILKLNKTQLKIAKKERLVIPGTNAIQAGGMGKAKVRIKKGKIVLEEITGLGRKWHFVKAEGYDMVEQKMRDTGLEVRKGFQRQMCIMTPHGRFGKCAFARYDHDPLQEILAVLTVAKAYIQDKYIIGFVWHDVPESDEDEEEDIRG